MAIAGPRLDRPSGVGDEGRPRATSVTLAALVVVGLSGLTLWQIGALSALTTLGLACVLLVGGLALLTRDTLGELAVGHLLYHAGAVSLLLFLFVTPLLRHSLVFLGLFLFEHGDAVGGVGPARDVAHAPGVGREHFEDVTLGEFVRSGLRLHNWHGTRCAFHVERLRDVEFGSHGLAAPIVRIGAITQYHSTD